MAFFRILQNLQDEYFSEKVIDGHVLYLQLVYSGQFGLKLLQT